jgi:hypothetical protein
VTASAKPAGDRSRAFWTFRVLETGLLLSALVGLALFAWSIVDIVRIETATVAATAPVATAAVAPASSGEPTSGAVAAAVQEMPPGAWPGIFLFFGSLLVLQPVRGILVRYRRDDGTRRDGATAAAATATAEALAAVGDDPGPVEGTGPQAEG